MDIGYQVRYRYKYQVRYEYEYVVKMKYPYNLVYNTFHKRGGKKKVSFTLVMLNLNWSFSSDKLPFVIQVL
jgi:hypothetical protein